MAHKALTRAREVLAKTEFKHDPLDQTLRAEHFEGLAERRARYSETDAQQLFRNARSGQQLALADHVSQLFDDFVMQRASLNTRLFAFCTTYF